ncbi:MAG: hypothetical protein Rhob2KO_40650 [Rhodopirellula baltica]
MPPQYKAMPDATTMAIEGQTEPAESSPDRNQPLAPSTNKNEADTSATTVNPLGSRTSFAQENKREVNVASEEGDVRGLLEFISDEAVDFDVP